jgi:hypothetical protein
MLSGAMCDYFPEQREPTGLEKQCCLYKAGTQFLNDCQIIILLQMLGILQFVRIRVIKL